MKFEFSKEFLESRFDLGVQHLEAGTLFPCNRVRPSQVVDILSQPRFLESETEQTSVLKIQLPKVEDVENDSKSNFFFSVHPTSKTPEWRSATFRVQVFFDCFFRKKKIHVSFFDFLFFFFQKKLLLFL